MKPLRKTYELEFLSKNSAFKLFKLQKSYWQSFLSPSSSCLFESHVIRKLVFGVSDQFHLNLGGQPQKMAKGLKFDLESGGAVLSM